MLLAFGVLLLPGALGSSDGADAEFGERQLQVRNTAYLNAYRGLGTLVILGALYYCIAVDADWAAYHLFLGSLWYQDGSPYRYPRVV